MKGFRDTDRTDFDAEHMPLLQRASFELSWLLDRGYPKDSARDFVGDRYQLTKRQRLLLARAVAGTVAARQRITKRLETTEAAGRHVSIDGFNVIVTLEVALTGGPIVSCQDSTVRDIAGMRGTYHPCDETTQAISMLYDYLDKAGAGDVDILVDAPVSNSGRLRSLLVDGTAAHPNLDVQVTLERDVDAVLSTLPDVIITSDSMILDHCSSWLNAAADILETIDDVWLIRPIGPLLQSDH